MTATLEAPMVVNGKRPEFSRTPGPAMPAAAPPRTAPGQPAGKRAIDWRPVGAVAVGVLVVASVIAVVVAAFVISFDGITRVSEAANVSRDRAWLMPVSIDGAMVTGTAVALVLRYHGRTPIYPYLVVGGGVAISIALNALHATLRDGHQLDTMTASAVSAIPAVMLALSVHQVAVLIQAVTGRRADTADTDTHRGPAVATAQDAPDMTTRPDSAPAIQVVRVSAPATTRPDTAPPDTTPDGADSGQDTPPAKRHRRAAPDTAPARGGQDTAARIAEYRSGHPDATQVQIAAALGLSDRTVRRNMPKETP